MSDRSLIRPGGDCLGTKTVGFPRDGPVKTLVNQLVKVFTDFLGSLQEDSIRTSSAHYFLPKGTHE